MSDIFSRMFAEKPFTLMEQALDAASMRHEVISGNIANVDTPGYKRKSVSFEGALKQELGLIDEDYRQGEKLSGAFSEDQMGRLSEFRPRVLEANRDQVMRVDGNNVDVEGEMALLAKNTMMFHAIASMLTMRLRDIKNVIKEGRG